MQNYKLGKKRARPGAVAFKFGMFFDRTKLPTPPAVFGHESIRRPWGMLANDQYGCCVWAGAAHETMMWANLAKKQPTFRAQDVLADYSAVTGFDPKRPDSDQGTDMTEAASYRRKTGIVDSDGARHVIDAYAALRPGHADDLALSTYLMGASGVGLLMPSTAEKQFDDRKPWSVVKGASVEGGHYVPCVGRNSNGDFLIVTWGRIHAMTREFYETYCDEAIAYVSIEGMNDKNLSPEGFNVEALRHDLALLSR